MSRHGFATGRPEAELANNIPPPTCAGLLRHRGGFRRALPIEGRGCRLLGIHLELLFDRLDIASRQPPPIVQEICYCLIWSARKGVRLLEKTQHLADLIRNFLEEPIGYAKGLRVGLHIFRNLLGKPLLERKEIALAIRIKIAEPIAVMHRSCASHDRNRIITQALHIPNQGIIRVKLGSESSKRIEYRRLLPGFRGHEQVVHDHMPELMACSRIEIMFCKNPLSVDIDDVISGSRIKTIPHTATPISVHRKRVERNSTADSQLIASFTNKLINFTCRFG